MSSPNTTPSSLPIELISDQAIAEIGNERRDTLGFSVYADILTRTIRGTRGPFTIGIFGEWGMGKTSLMRMIERNVQTTHSTSPLVIPVWFNAWMFERLEYPIIPLVKSVTQALKTHESLPEKLKSPVQELIRTLEALIGAFKLKAKVGLADTGTEIEFDTGAALARYNQLKQAAGTIIDTTDPYEEILAAFKRIGDSSVPRDITILVLIDDLDRCFPENAVKLLESIKLVLSQSGFIFVLGASRSIIEDHLEAKYDRQINTGQIRGHAYLDKIIQLSFDIPPHTGRIDEFARLLTHTLTSEDAKYELYSISTIIGAACYYNPRTVIRFFNRLIIDSAIYKAGLEDPQALMPIGIFAVTRSLQQAWKPFYELLATGTIEENRRRCIMINDWTIKNINTWVNNVGSENIDPNDIIAQRIHKLSAADQETAKHLISQLSDNPDLRILMNSSVGKQWLNDHKLREASISFLLTQPSDILRVDDVVEKLLYFAAESAIRHNQISASRLQREFHIGAARATEIMKRLAKMGVINPGNEHQVQPTIVASLEQVNFDPILDV